MLLNALQRLAAYLVKDVAAPRPPIALRLYRCVLPSTRLLSLFLGRETESQSFGAPRCRSKVRARKLILKHLTPVLRGAAARRNPESPPGWCRVSGSHLSYWSRSSKTSWDWFLTHRQSHTYTHEHARTHTPTHTHTHAGARTPTPGELEFAEPALGNSEPEREARRAPGPLRMSLGALEKSPQRLPRAGGAPLEPPTPAPARSPRQLQQVSTHRGASPFPAASPWNPHFAPLGRPPSSPRRAPLRASGGPAHFPGAAETPPPAAAAGRSGSSSPLSPAAAAAAAGASRAALMYYSLGWPGRFLESPRRRCEVFGGRLLVQRSQFLGNWGVLRGRRNAFFFSCRGGWLFCPELAGARGAPGPGRSVPEPASAVGSPASGQGGGSAGKRRVGGLES